MKKVILSISVTLASMAGMAQINVFSGNTVGIGAGLASEASTLGVNTIGVSTATLSLTPLSVHSKGLLFSAPGTASCIGVYSAQSNVSNGPIIRGVWGYSYNTTVQTSGQAYGVMGTAGNSTTGYNFGVWGNLLGSNNGAAVYGQTGTTQLVMDAQYAGYFYGTVKVNGQLYTSSGTITGSDQKLKKNIVVLDTSAANGIFSLQPKKYNLKTNTELVASGVIKLQASDTGKTHIVSANDTLDYIKKQHFGFIAQDIQKVFPNLVYTSGDGTLGVDYMGFIPIIVAQLQQMKQTEQQLQQQITTKEAEIQALQQAVVKLKGKN